MERSGSAGLDAGAAQLLHEVAHREPLGDVVGGEPLAAGVHGVGAFFDHPRRKRDILGDHEVTGRGALGDQVIGGIKAALHLQGADEPRAGRSDPLVRHQGDVNPGTLRGAEQDVLDGAGAGVGIHPDAGARRWGVGHPRSITGPAMAAASLAHAVDTRAGGILCAPSTGEP